MCSLLECLPQFEASSPHPCCHLQVEIHPQRHMIADFVPVTEGSDFHALDVLHPRTGKKAVIEVERGRFHAFVEMRRACLFAEGFPEVGGLLPARGDHQELEDFGVVFLVEADAGALAGFVWGAEMAGNFEFGGNAALPGFVPVAVEAGMESVVSRKGVGHAEGLGAVSAGDISRAEIPVGVRISHAGERVFERIVDVEIDIALFGVPLENNP